MSVAVHELAIDANLRSQRPNLRLVLPLTTPTAREVWITQTAEDIHVVRSLDRQSAYEGATLAAFWLEDYAETKDSYESMEWSRDFRSMLLCRGRDPKGAMLASYERVAKDPTPVSVRLAAIYAFCEGLDVPTVDTWTLLTTQDA